MAEAKSKFSRFLVAALILVGIGQIAILLHLYRADEDLTSADSSLARATHAFDLEDHDGPREAMATGDRLYHLTNFSIPFRHGTKRRPRVKGNIWAPYSPGYNVFTHFDRTGHRWEAKDVNATFAHVYEHGTWQHGSKLVPGSGTGSTFQCTVWARLAIQSVVLVTAVRGIMDVSCGDGTWIPMLFPWFDQLGVTYRGADIVQSVIEKNRVRYPEHQWSVLDMVHEDLPSMGPDWLILCRKSLQHLEAGDVLTALERFSRSGARWLMTTMYLGLKNNLNQTDTAADRRSSNLDRIAPRSGRNTLIDLLSHPYYLDDPVAMWTDGSSNEGQYLALFELPLHGVVVKDAATSSRSGGSGSGSGSRPTLQDEAC